MKYILTTILALNLSSVLAQDPNLDKSFSRQHFKCYEVKYFSELKERINNKKTQESEAYLMSRGRQTLGFLFFQDSEPQFFLANKNTFALFFTDGINESIGFYDSILGNPHSVHVVDAKKKIIYNITLLWRYPNFSISSCGIWKFNKRIVEEFTAYPNKKIRPINLLDTLIYNHKIDILEGVQFEKIKSVGVQKNDNNLKPSILVFLMNLIK